MKLKLTERASTKNPQIDKEAGIISDVKIIGLESKNGRTYTKQALQQALKHYEGVDVNIDHPDRDKPHAERKISEGFGQIKNARLQSDGVYGDLHYIKSHPQADVVIERAERFDNFGLSHVAEGDGIRRGGKLSVESIVAVHSVDIVNKPATTAGLFESVEVTEMTQTLREVIVEKYPKTGAKVLKEIDDGELVASPEMVSPVQTAVDAPVTSEASSPVDTIRLNLAAEAQKIIADPNIDTKETIKQVVEVIKVIDVVANKLEGKAVPNPSDRTDSESLDTGNVTTEESIQITGMLGALDKKLDRIEHSQEVSLVLSESGLTIAGIGVERHKLIESQGDLGGMRALIGSWPNSVTRPSRKPFIESVNSRPEESGCPSTFEEYVAASRS